MKRILRRKIIKEMKRQIIQKMLLAGYTHAQIRAMEAEGSFPRSPKIRR